MKIKKIIKAVGYLNYILDTKQKLFGIIVLVLVIIGAGLETVGVSVILPLMQAMTDFENASEQRLVSFLLQLFQISSSRDFIIRFGLFIGLFYLIKSIYSVFLSWVRAKYSCKIQRELSVRTFNSFIERGYDFFLQNNTSDLMRRINVDIPSVQSIIQYGFKVCTEFLTVACIFIYVLCKDAVMALFVVGLGVICGIVIIVLNKNKVRKYGISSRDKDWRINSIMLQTFQGIKEVLVMHKQSFFSNEYQKEYENYSEIMIGKTVLEEMPLYAIEGICVSGLLSIVSIRAALSNNISSFIPLMATFAVAAFRALPSLAKLSSYTNAALYYSESLIATYNNFRILNEEMKEKNRDARLIEMKKAKDCDILFEFKERIDITSLSWHYSDSEIMVLDGINLTIKKGMAIGIIGKSGSGKSTLIDILLGLHIPTKGQVEVDGISIYSIPSSWSKMIGYVPQSIYLTDSSIRNNIAFGVPSDQIDDEMVDKCIQKAMLKDYINGLPDGLDTIIGERGVRMSGGQRQRLAIARALYHDPQILILDEATSALDYETEEAVMNAIENLHGTITLIIVAHRLNTVMKCDRIIEIRDGRIMECESKSFYGI